MLPPVTPVGSSEPQLPLLMAMSFRLMTDRVHARLAEEGQGQLRPAHGFVISHLVTSGGVSAVDLAAYLGITKQGAGYLVGELEDWGYVERIANPRDGRSRLVVATGKGAGVVTRVAQLWAEEEVRWAHLVGPAQLHLVREALAAYVATGGDGRPSMRPVW
jgi:DNA-binding MarR family transcriptional regulator